MATAVIVCGLQGAGKSTFVRLRFADTHVRINLDMLRTRNRESALMHACLAAEISFVVDNTNPTPDRRKRYADLARASGFEVECYHVDTPADECLARNAAREGSARVPDVAVTSTAAKWVDPTKFEGYDRLYRVRAAGGDFLVEECP